MFDRIIFDDKTGFQESIVKLKRITHANKFVIFENNHQFFDNEQVEIVEHLKTDNFDVKGYYITI